MNPYFLSGYGELLGNKSLQTHNGHRPRKKTIEARVLKLELDPMHLFVSEIHDIAFSEGTADNVKVEWL